MRAAWIPLFLMAACGDNIRGNRPPTAENVTLTTQEDIPITRAIDADDLDDDMLVAGTPLPPMHGHAIASGLSITYTPDPDFHGNDQFLVPVSDGTEEINVTVMVSVLSVNDAPFGVADSVATNEDIPRTIPIAQLIGNDSDNDGDLLSLTTVHDPVNGTVAINTTNVVFTPAANFNGGASFIYDITDGTDTVQVPVSVVIDPINDAPVAVDDTGTAVVALAKVFTTAQLVANDTDVDSGTLTISSIKNQVNCTAVFDANSGDITFTGLLGTATFEYVVTDGTATDTGLVTVTVSP